MAAPLLQGFIGVVRCGGHTQEGEHTQEMSAWGGGYRDAFVLLLTHRDGEEQMKADGEVVISFQLCLHIT